MKVNIQSVALRLVAMGLTALLFVLGLSGIRAIARGDLGKSASNPLGLASFPLAPDELPQAPPTFPFQQPSLQTIWNRIPFPSSTSSLTASASAQPVGTAAGYLPQQEIASADPSNFGDRYTKDVYGKAVSNDPIVVLHETVGTASSAINTFQTPHPNEDDQVSYHSLIRLNGSIIYVVPPLKRAFGAGNSVYIGANGPEAVKTHPLYPASVNNFAYHISLESPSDGHNNALSHSGYTEAQYQSLAWLVAQTQVPVERIATHKTVDRSRSRIDPRSFDNGKFLSLLRPYLESAQKEQSLESKRQVSRK